MKTIDDYNNYQKRYNDVLKMHCRGEGFCKRCHAEVSVYKQKDGASFVSYFCSQCNAYIDSWRIDGSGLPVNEYTM